MKIDRYKDIVTSAKATVLALFFGGMFGFMGIAPAAGHECSLIGIFGGIGLFIASFDAYYLLPIIHCVYAYCIVRFKLRGILFVILLHYVSAIIMTAIWIRYDLHPDVLGLVMDFVKSDYSWRVIYFIFSIPHVVAIVIYNAFLLSLLFGKVRKKLRLEGSASPN